MDDTIIRTHSGLLINLLDPDPKLITLGDIAHSLSQVNRYGGHSNQPYSVAEHSIIVAHGWADPKMYRTALLHDAAEYAIGDMVGPLKHSWELRTFVFIESTWESALTERFDLHPPGSDEHKEVKERDKEIVSFEASFMRDNPCRVAPAWQDVKFQFATLARTKGEIRG